MTSRAPSQRNSRCRAAVFWVLVAVSVVAISAGLWQLRVNHQALAAESAPAAVAGTGQAAANFRLMAVDGKQVQLSDLRGKVVLLNFWATWCPPCKAEMPDLEALYREYGSQQNFMILGVDVEESQAAVSAFAQQNGLSFLLLLDSQGTVSNGVYPIRSLPTSMIIDREGKIRDMWIGQISQSAMVARLGRVW
jgi:cytochrome c biogenesis protein CcmG, thiol:disulfide interchange protein DsbE